MGTNNWHLCGGGGVAGNWEFYGAWDRLHTTHSLDSTTGLWYIQTESESYLHLFLATGYLHLVRQFAHFPHAYELINHFEAIECYGIFHTISTNGGWKIQQQQLELVCAWRAVFVFARALVLPPPYCTFAWNNNEYIYVNIYMLLHSHRALSANKNLRV